MRVINARINSNSVLSGTDATHLYSTCSVYGVPSMINVFNSEQLITAMERFKDEKIMIFSNYPPNSSYPGSENFGVKLEEGNAWIADAYSMSAKLFVLIAYKYDVEAIHFISGAPEQMINEKKLQRLLPKTTVTFKSYGDFYSSFSFENEYVNYFASKIKVFAEKYIG